MALKSEERPPAYTENERPPCPFYGFISCGEKKVLLDLRKNSCALMRGYSSCAMEFEYGKKPDFDRCPLRNEEEVISYLKELGWHLRVFPQEFFPPEAKLWGGITFRQWLDFLNKIHERNF